MFQRDDQKASSVIWGDLICEWRLFFFLLYVQIETLHWNGTDLSAFNSTFIHTKACLWHHGQLKNFQSQKAEVTVCTLLPLSLCMCVAVIFPLYWYEMILELRQPSTLLKANGRLTVWHTKTERRFVCLSFHRDFFVPRIYASQGKTYLFKFKSKIWD